MSESIEAPLSLPPGLLASLQQKATAKQSTLQAQLEAAVTCYLDAEDAPPEGAELEHQGSLRSLYIAEPIITLVDGLLRGEHNIAHALAHGDFGLGTLNNLDGEVVVLEGVPYHQRANGTTRVLKGDEPTPFMTCTWFERAPKRRARLAAADDFDALKAQLTDLVGSTNVVHAIRITGKFSVLRGRAVCRVADGTRLKDAAQHQALFELNGEDGDLVGFWSPEFIGASINEPGYHFHYISADRQRGGHVLNVSVDAGALAQVVEIHRCTFDMPFSDAFMTRRLLLKGLDEDLRAAQGEKHAAA